MSLRLVTLATTLTAAGLIVLSGCGSDGPAPSVAASDVATSDAVPASPPETSPPTTTASATTGASASATSSSAYRTVTNARYGFRCEVPAAFRTAGESVNGDGTTYTSADGRTTVSCSGANNLPDVGSESPKAARAQSVAGHEADGDDVTLEVVTGNAVTVSGTLDDGDVFYERTLWGPGSTNTLRWVYPREDKQAYDAAVERTAGTFRAGDTAQAH